MRLDSLKCGGPAWLIGWAVAVFLPSALIAHAGLSPPALAIGTGFDRILATTWKVADDVGPAAKLLLGALLALLFLASSRLTVERTAVRYVLNATLGVAAMAVTLALIPAAFSRGFGIGLTGARFDWASFPQYALGGLAAGIVFTFMLARCAGRRAG
ncbi:MAG: hypothetical protein V4574_18090 [Pseudomonadota bacterium]